MALHRLTTVTIGVPDVDTVGAFYRDFGLTDLGGGRFATRDGGEQLRLRPAPLRRCLELGLGVDDPDDLDRLAAAAGSFGVAVERGGDRLRIAEPVSGLAVVVGIAPRIEQDPAPVAQPNQPGWVVRTGARAPAVLRDQPVQPRKLGHVVLGSADQATTQRFFTEALGFKVSDEIAGVAGFLRCSSDHHNLLIQAAPVPFVHHTSWQVDDVDEIGRGAKAMLDADPARHVWGLGRHYLGSNFFWYLRDPAGNFAEYHSDLDVIVDDELWEPSALADERALYAWGPPPPASFLAPDDLAELMAGD